MLMVPFVLMWQVVAFLERLSELRSMTPLAASMCRALDAAYGLDGAKNCEIRCAWYKVHAFRMLDAAFASVHTEMIVHYGEVIIHHFECNYV